MPDEFIGEHHLERDGALAGGPAGAWAGRGGSGDFLWAAGAGAGHEVARAHREVEYARLSGRDPQEAHRRFEAAIQNFQGAIDRAQRGAKALSPQPEIVDTLIKLSRDVRPTADREKWLKATQEIIKK